MMIGLTSDAYGMIPISWVLRVMRWSGVLFSELTINCFQSAEKVLQRTRGMRFGLHLPNIGSCGFDLSAPCFCEKIEWILDLIQSKNKPFQFKYAVTHPPEAEPEKWDFDYYISNLKRIDIPLVLENIPGWSVEKFRNFYLSVQEQLGDRLSGMCLDIPHAFLTGVDWRNYLEVFGPEIKVIHLSNCANGKDCHYPFGMKGDLCLDHILETLRQRAYQGILNFELMPPSIDKIGFLLQTHLRARTFFDPHDLQGLQNRLMIINSLATKIKFLSTK